jgi:hypothetical protein
MFDKSLAESRDASKTPTMNIAQTVALYGRGKRSQ